MNAVEFNEKFFSGRSERIGSSDFLVDYCVPRIHCNDGFVMSVQASKTHYCTPRDNYGPWTHFEIGFPSHEEPLIMGHVEDPSAPTETVYGYVPVGVILDVIEKHGGIDDSMTKTWRDK